MYFGVQSGIPAASVQGRYDAIHKGRFPPAFGRTVSRRVLDHRLLPGSTYAILDLVYQIGIFCGGVYMIFLKVLAVVLGLAFLLFGYFIYFKKKYNLINGFEADFKAGRKKEEYAKKVGMIEFVVGIVLLITGVALYSVCLINSSLSIRFSRSSINLSVSLREIFALVPAGALAPLPIRIFLTKPLPAAIILLIGNKGVDLRGAYHGQARRPVQGPRLYLSRLARFTAAWPTPGTTARLGVELKNNVKRAWWKKFVQESPYNVGLDCGHPDEPARCGWPPAMSAASTTR